MATLHLVRHGQASLGAADYDQLSELGRRQCVRLGEVLRQRGQRFHAVYTGTLRRHAQSLDALVQGYGELPAARARSGLDEYDSHAVIHAIHPQPLERPHDAASARQHFKLLREGLAAWIDARTAPEGMPSHTQFLDGVRAVLDEVRQADERQVLVVSSGGPISHALALALGTTPHMAVELNLRLRNTAVSQLVFTRERFTLDTFNHLPHLDGPGYADWITYA